MKHVAPDLVGAEPVRADGGCSAVARVGRRPGVGRGTGRASGAKSATSTISSASTAASGGDRRDPRAACARGRTGSGRGRSRAHRSLILGSMTAWTMSTTRFATT